MELEAHRVRERLRAQEEVVVLAEPARLAEEVLDVDDLRVRLSGTDTDRLSPLC